MRRKKLYFEKKKKKKKNKYIIKELWQTITSLGMASKDGDHLKCD